MPLGPDGVRDGDGGRVPTRHDPGVTGTPMIDPDVPAPPDASAQAGLAARGATVGSHDELRAAPGGQDGALAPLWQGFFDALGSSGWADLAAREARIQRRVREDGATYNVHADPSAAAPTRAWPLQTLPFLLDAEEWADIEAGVAQRARLLNATLADVYGPQTLLKKALLPPSLVFAHPQYLRPAHGIVPLGGVHLHHAAFDLARGPDGRWWVLAQRVQAPSGLGYLLENRLVVAPQFQEAFSALRVQRLASSFQSLLDALLRLSPAGERSRVALLTPGPLHETYFEQVFLARYLGITLVEAGDLTVRGNRLHLKTLHGLERVHVLLRRVDDEWLDPLELRADSALGVPGLLQSLRAGEVVVANAPGAGFLESPGLAAFWPAVARKLLGEELLLPASTHWWCGEASVWQAQRTRLADFVVAPTFPTGPNTQGFEPLVASDLDQNERAALAARIDADPAAFTLQARVRPSETPCWTHGVLEPRPAVLRVFALAHVDEQGQVGWRVLPGGLTRVAARRDGAHDPWLSMQHGSASADTWVVARGEVDKRSLLPQPLTVQELQGWHRTVTSRAAENLFWLGRYTERAENSVRLARVVLEGLAAAPTDVRAWLGTLSRWHGLVGEGVPDPAGSPQSARVFERALVHALSETADGTASVGYNLSALRQCAQALRERLSPEHWKLIQEVDDHFEQRLAEVVGGAGLAARPWASADVVGVLARAATHLAAITGAQTDRMTRDDGWRLLSVGRQIERLDMLAHALYTGLQAGVHRSDEGFALLLGLFDSLITYRAQFQARREMLPLIHLLVLDTDNPRSLAWVARTLRDRLRKLARHEAAWVKGVTDALPAPEQWSLESLGSVDDAGRLAALELALQDICAAARALSDAIGLRLFAHVTQADRSVWQ
jgi:uncharacterized circularly permuted ATP-grasp superfamily protein/uncharacterized alpha-E superfamily protein